MHIIVTLISLLSITVFYYFYKLVIRPIIRMRHYKKQGIPTQYFPLIGYAKNLENGIEKHNDYLHYTKNLARTKPSRALCSNLGGDPLIFLYDPALIKAFYLNNGNYIKDPLYLELFAPIAGKGIITSEGNEWKRQRKVMSGAFHFEYLKNTLSDIQSLTHETLSEFKKTGLNKINIVSIFQILTGEIVGRLFFGEQLTNYTYDGKALTQGLSDLILDITNFNEEPLRYILGGKFILMGLFPSHRKLVKRMKEYRSVCHAIINNRKEALRAAKGTESNKPFKDLLQIMLDHVDEQGKIDEDEIVDQFTAVFFAGMGSTAHTLLMCLYFLNKYPEYKTRLLEEIKANYKTPENTVTVESLNTLVFTMAFIRETLRMATPLTELFPRKAIKDHKLKDLHIRKGDIVNLDYLYNNYDPAYFDNVDTFDPERWLDKRQNIDAYVFTPFSGGPRNCIGQHLALNEARIILSEFLLMYEYKLQDNYKLQMDLPFFYSPVDPILLDLTPKTN